jgi:hypothetical protein
MKEMHIIRIGDHPFCTYQIGGRNVGDEEGLASYLTDEGVDEEQIQEALQALKKEGSYTIRVL